MTPAQTQAIEKLRAMNRQLEECAVWTPTIAVIREIEVVLALLEDEPVKEHEPMPIVERCRWPECQCPDRGCKVIKAEVRCRFPKCNCTFPRRCKA